MMGAIINCCHYCVPPKRHPGCHDHCPEYAAEKAEHNRLKEADYKRRKAKNDIYSQRTDNVAKALKRHGRN